MQVDYQAIRVRCRKIGPPDAEQLRRRRSGPGDEWHVDEVPVKICGQTYWLWRVADQDGFVLDIFVPREAK